MSFDMALESMMIPNVVGNDYPEELSALENWVIDMEAALIAEDIQYCAALEADGMDAGSEASPSSFVTRIRMAFNKLRSGKKNGDEAAVADAAKEIQEASDEFSQEAENEENPEKKKRWKKAAIIIAGIVAAVGVAIGVVALSKNAKNKASSGQVTPSEASSMAKQAADAAKKASPAAIKAPEDNPALPAHKDAAALPGKADRAALPSGERLALPAPKPTQHGTGASVVKEDGSTEKILSRSEQKAANRTASYGTPNPNGNRAQRRASTFKEETPAQKKARLLREAAQHTAASGGTVSKEQARRINNAEKKVKMQETANAHKIIANANALRGEQKKSGQTPAAPPAENSAEIKDLVSQVQSHFANMKAKGGLTVKTSGSGNTFYKRTKQGDQAKVYKKEIDGMAQAIARLTQLGYNGDAIDMYNQLKKVQK